MRYTQPQSGARIDWSNPLTKDLCFCVNGVDGSLDLVSGKRASTTKPTIATVEGVGISATAGTYALEWPHAPIVGSTGGGSGNATLMAIANPAASALGGTLIGQAMSGSPYAQIQLMANLDGLTGSSSSGVATIESYNSGNTGAANASGVIDGLMHVFVGVKYSTYENTHKLYVDGVDKSTASAYIGNFGIAASSRITVGGEAYGTTRSVNAAIPFAAAWNRALSAAEVIALSNNPWQIFADNKKPIFIGVGAAPSGLSITADLATASASGYAATVNLQSAIHTTLATATASGFTASVGTGNAITATLATATASGQTATVNRQSNITATQAVASASGQIATVNRQLAIAATLATATASGQTATVNIQRSVAATQAAATATGYTANVQLGNDLSISATQAAATASGFDAAINRQLSIAATLATATASGFDASISNGASIAASYGLASADGYQAQVNLQREIAATLATASASGFTAAISTSTGTAVWPTPDQVLSGITYGPTGADYTGTATAGSFPSAIEIAAAVRVELAVELAMVDATISSRATVAAIMGATAP